MPDNQWGFVPLRQLFRINGFPVIPADRPKSLFHYHSIPSFDENGGCVVEFGSEIESNKTKINKPSVLVSKLNPRKPRVSLAEPKGDEEHCCSTEFICYEPKNEDEVLEFWRAYFLSSGFAKRLEQIAVGSTNSHTRAAPRETLDWLVPNPSESQKRVIATILDTLDTQIRQTEAIIAKLQQVKQGLLHDLLTRGIDESGQLRPPYEQAPELYKESPLGWIPKIWNYDRLSSKSVPGMAHIKTGPFGSALKGEHWVEEGCPVITIGSLGTGEFIFSELLFVSKRDEVRLSDYALKKGEVVFSRVADVGRSVAINDEQEGWIMSSNLMKISLDPALVNSQFLQYQLSHPQIAKLQIRRNVNSAGRDVANSAILNQLLFFWPSKEEQDRLVKRISLLEERISNEKDSLEKLKKQKTGLMDDLLTGRMRVTELIEQEQQAS
ncbi:restriction endonuclease subunit S [Chromohalobacter israelensis]|uniref:restriction endonuclease subunit S n=1 Tax=Chromohalobacter israelensis TaxID=141390 RepID=UPI00265BF78E|nr:restriction endonuclease subunit S [Chromohalobacter salexigens]MDO0945597.1 restriction endonuclease subunit S [Chromohalobacter salexigens]